MINLTEKQKDILKFLKDEIRLKGYPPSVREICKAINLKSTSSVHLHLSALEKKGYIKKAPQKNRSIEILEKDFYNNSTIKEYIDVPIIGKVTAGVPILAVENIEDTFPIPIEYVNNDDVFMLRISGNSMIGAGINDKDLVLVKKQNTAINGDIIVALLDEYATVKTFYRDKDFFRLQPENPIYEPILVKDISIIGKVTGLFRKF